MEHFSITISRMQIGGDVGINLDCELDKKDYVQQRFFFQNATMKNKELQAVGIIITSNEPR